MDACCDTHRTYMPQHARSFVPFVPAISLLPNGPYACSLHYRGIWRRFFGASGWRSVRAGWLRRRPAPFAEHSILRGARSPLGWPQGPRLRFHQIDSAVHCVSQFLLAAEIALGRLDRDMPEQKIESTPILRRRGDTRSGPSRLRVQIRPSFLGPRIWLPSGWPTYTSGT